ncbi:4-hydroxy-3-methylbut-2-enyl diphosphate reductase [Cyclobacterium marinum]|uniref:4-hydroxy-3-methylbut-2-enyl diphosphate reductase n=1 Tax=Cyclobacterium marinum TaxID=104 RepID=UPI0011EC97EF|nr:4-hydroxy-3-methylbut-2-enyl diphosphate reductase [Cyclobacterium marinum]MBI0401470.1 4-hydroxy-3-methylbut-2-enyl diphosphate reductase [Cyclobacterium marinum]
MLKLNVHIDQFSGFCFGVVYAIEMAEDILNEEGHLYCLGDIVHNDEEVKRLTKKGLIIINHEELKNLTNEKVLIRAHGEPPATYELAIKNNLILVDASCPVVLKLQNRIKNSFDKDENIYIYGKHGHAEVIGLLGQTRNKAVVFQDINELDLENIPKNITLYSQTTKSTDKFYEINNILKDNGITINTNDTICRQVSNRDKELRGFAAQFDHIVFVSGTKSSNGKVLFNVCKEKNPQTYFVSCPEEVDPNWFKTGQSVGICGATSTPMWLMEKVEETIKKL